MFQIKEKKVEKRVLNNINSQVSNNTGSDMLNVEYTDVIVPIKNCLLFSFFLFSEKFNTLLLLHLMIFS